MAGRLAPEPRAESLASLAGTSDEAACTRTGTFNGGDIRLADGVFDRTGSILIAGLPSAVDAGRCAVTGNGATTPRSG